MTHLGRACLSELSAYAAAGPQADLRQRFLDHLDAYPDDGWLRECAGAHLTASSLICSPTADRVLLVRHRKLERWLQTGGHFESDDADPSAAALREAGEESGLDDLRVRPGLVHLDAHRVPCGPIRPCWHLDLRYLVIADPLQTPPGSEESTAVGWFDHDDLPTDEPSVTDLVAVARRLLTQ